MKYIKRGVLLIDKKLFLVYNLTSHNRKCRHLEEILSLKRLGAYIWDEVSIIDYLYLQAKSG